MNNAIKLVLASGSPRRRELCAHLGYDFIVAQPDVDESASGLPPENLVVELARRKARCVASKERGVVLGADTVVVLDGQILGKPRDRQDACRMLSMLSGREHTVFTGVCVIDARIGGGRELTRCVCTQVQFAVMTDAQIRQYIDTGEPMDKAGAYGIQGRGGVFVERINGCYFNVMGLPLNTVKQMLEMIL